MDLRRKVLIPNTFYKVLFLKENTPAVSRGVLPFISISILSDWVDLIRQLYLLWLHRVRGFWALTG
jgi:hypothetical protein